MINQKTLVDFLKNQNPNAKFLDKLKIVYRPYIWPLNELLNEIPKNKSVFDIGCGSGQFALLIA
jgi:2-polyprenyl-3-methyl-5-hydroxy-6-metoxy-1,4-benzoquinol methylase